MISTLFAAPPDNEHIRLVDIVPRDYQHQCHDNAFRLWDADKLIGALARAFTSAGKTLIACMIARTWLNRGPDQRVMVVNYEQQLVWQFAQEIEDYLGLTAGIEMGEERIPADRIPRIVVASRQSLAPKSPATPKQCADLLEHGIADVGSLTEPEAKKLLRALHRGMDDDAAKEMVECFNARPEAYGKSFARLHKFDPLKYNWLIIADEAHRHSYALPQTRCWVDWFERNPNNRRLGITATPKRSDNVSIGSRLFPGIALDYPLIKAVEQGYAVPYIQRYISVAGVDFKDPKQIARKANGDFDDAALERVLNTEGTLAKLIEPLLDLVGDRRTLIFSPTVQMAKDSASYINARRECQCPCGNRKWYAALMIGDGAVCECGRLVSPDDVTKRGDQAREIDGAIPQTDRKEVYEGFAKGEFQFLSVCGLCREGYNQREISCVALFRPVTKKAASLAEQMKGRGCRVPKGVIDGLATAEERLAALENQPDGPARKTDCLIVDLVGATGLGDCPSTLSIYAAGLPDEVRERAEDLVAASADDEDASLLDAIEEAKKQIADEREAIRREREAAEQRAKREAELRAAAGATVEYSSHEVGHGANIDPNAASDKQLGKIAFLGMRIQNVAMTKKQAGRIINQLLSGESPDAVAYSNRLDRDHWEHARPSGKQQYALSRAGVNDDRIKTPHDASIVIGAVKAPDAFLVDRLEEIRAADSEMKLSRIATDMTLVKGRLDERTMQSIRSAWANKRGELRHGSGTF